MHPKRVLKSGIEKQRYSKIKQDYYYLVIIYKNHLGRIKIRYLIKYAFKDYKAIVKYKKLHPQLFKDRFLIPTLGYKLIDYQIRHRKRFMNMIGLNINQYLVHDYPPERITEQDRKSLRTKLRRWERNNINLNNNFK